MLKRFEVSGFKNFKNKIVLDFSDTRDYQFNTNCIRDGLVNKAIIYGKNGVGKTNLGLALFDITTHLVDKNITPGVYDYYTNADILAGTAEFVYEFQFGANTVVYKYRKDDQQDLTYEELELNNELLFSYDFFLNKYELAKLERLFPTLNFDFKDNKLSILRYVVNNSMIDSDSPLKRTVDFVSNMLLFRSLDEYRFIGYKSKATDFYEFIFEDEILDEFQHLLFDVGIDECLAVKEDASGKKMLCFSREVSIPFFKVASNGTKALYVFFYWLKTAKDVSLLFIDEFDAFYHFELAETIVKLLEQYTGFQTILTSHNTNLLTNRIMRPDCYFILTKDRLTSLANATQRELREGHNLEKLYKNGEFDA